MRATFNAWPEVHEVSHVHAPLEDTLLSRCARTIAYLTLDAMITNFVARAERVGVVSERPVLDALGVANTIAPKAEFGVKEYRFRECPSVKLFCPVSTYRVNFLRLYPKYTPTEDSRLAALVATFGFESILMGIHKEAVKRKKLTLLSGMRTKISKIVKRKKAALIQRSERFQPGGHEWLGSRQILSCYHGGRWWKACSSGRVRLRCMSASPR